MNKTENSCHPALSRVNLIMTMSRSIVFSRALHPLNIERLLCTIHHYHNSGYSYKDNLLTIATAKQLKGDIPKAIELAEQALRQQQQVDSKNSNRQHDIYDTTLFLGKLFQSQRNYAQAEAYVQQSFHHAAQGSREEYVALSHLATIQRLQQNYVDAEHNYKAALTGLEENIGWKDGFTNHTSMELVKLYRETSREPKAIDTLHRMRKKLAQTFQNDNDPRVVQLYGDEAEIQYALGNLTEASRLWNEVVNRLAGNSPVARKAFMQLVELQDGDDDDSRG